MKLTNLIFQNYKTFSSEYNLEIKPITILIGPNSSGKSAIARLPILLARSLSGISDAPLDLEFDGMDFASFFRELVHNQSPRNNIRLGFSFEDSMSQKWSLIVRIQGFDEYHLQIVEYFELMKDDISVFTAQWSGNDPKTEPKKYYVNTYKREMNIEFKGLIPLNISEPVNIEELLSKKLRVNYLGPFREQPQRTYRFSGDSPSNVGPGGSKAPQILAGVLSHGATRKDRKVLEDAGEWFAKNLGGWKLDVEKDGAGFSLIMVNIENPALHINLRDVGTGIAQVLPMVVQKIFDSVHEPEESLEIIEQPELHLHPQAHGDLADLYVAACKKINTRFLIETHSELFLLRLRRRIAEGKLHPDNVIFYWIKGESGKDKIMPIHIDLDGEVDIWPTDVFSDAYREIMAIRRAQKRKGKKEDMNAG